MRNLVLEISIPSSPYRNWTTEPSLSLTYTHTHTQKKKNADDDIYIYIYIYMYTHLIPSNPDASITGMLLYQEQVSHNYSILMS